jgi:hypothetical protein
MQEEPEKPDYQVLAEQDEPEDLSIQGHDFADPVASWWMGWWDTIKLVTIGGWGPAILLLIFSILLGASGYEAASAGCATLGIVTLCYAIWYLLRDNNVDI